MSWLKYFLIILILIDGNSALDLKLTIFLDMKDVIVRFSKAHSCGIDISSKNVN